MLCETTVRATDERRRASRRSHASSDSSSAETEDGDDEGEGQVEVDDSDADEDGQRYERLKIRLPEGRHSIRASFLKK
eukprot:3078767-Heterocapsa_arctica.AAC.1